jgi:tRNA-dihydrouridine synthase C
MKFKTSPPLFLAPMEGVGDRAFRKASSTIGGFDYACTEFIRVPSNAHVVSLAKVYEHDLTDPIPQAAQIMGSDPETMALMAKELQRLKAPRIDLNCGCPSNTVTGRGAGSSLLKEPLHLYKVAKAIVEAVDIPVTAKLRTGFSDTSLFEENIFAAQESGIKFLTLHARTKEDGYRAPANWEYIAKAKQLLKIPIIGNGDICSKEDAYKMLKETNCDGIMIGRWAATNPFIFHEIKSFLNNQEFIPQKNIIEKFLRTYYQEMPLDMPEKTKINKLKQLLGFMFLKNDNLKEKRQAMLTEKYVSSEAMLEKNLMILIDIYF